MSGCCQTDLEGDEEIMADIEKVIEELEERIKVAEECMGNPMFTPDAIRTIVAMLKEQNAELQYRKPKKITHNATIRDDATCPSCGNVVGDRMRILDSRVNIQWKYCVFCGQELDWEGR